MDFLQGLNPQQQRAVAHVDGPLLILAGAGSGKTRVITHRICHLITAHKVHPSTILAVTFTNKAAGEMRERVEHMLRAGNYGALPQISTFHSFCVRMLRRDGARLADIRRGFSTQFTIYDDDDQLAVVKRIYRALGLDEKAFLNYRGALSAISHAKSHKKDPQDLHSEAKDDKSSKLAVVYERYQNALLEANALDFDDLLLEAVRLLRHDEGLRKQYNRRFAYLMIDEYQDTNRSQYELMRLLSEERHNVAVVGDEDQSIYSWRGADIRNILEFEKDYPKALVIRLEQNYRSTKNILEAASRVVSNNKERKGKWLWTDSGDGDKVGLYEAVDGENEALYIADCIDKIFKREPDAQVAVLYRTNFQSRQIEEALRRYGRRYSVVGGFSFYQRAEIKDALAYLKLAMSPQDSISLLRIINTPARGIGKSTVEQIEQYALEHSQSVWNAIGSMLDAGLLAGRAGNALESFRSLIDEIGEGVRERRIDETLRMILVSTGYGRMLEAEKSPEAESRLGNLQELVSAAAEAAERGEGPNEFLDHAALISDADTVDERAPISLLTMHNAKGLEFPYVFIGGLEEGLFPHMRSIQNESMIEEERRLCYVGMTRARKRLTLSWARMRRRFGGAQPERSIKSRFLNEVPRELLQPLGAAAAQRAANEVDLFSERSEARETVKKNMYTGKTYNSLENIAQFFAERGVQPPGGMPQRNAGTLNAPAPPVAAPPAAPPLAKPAASVPQRAPRKGLSEGVSVQHPKYGRGTILRREGDGEEAKLTVSFPGFGLKKLVAKYAGLIRNE